MKAFTRIAFVLLSIGIFVACSKEKQDVPEPKNAISQFYKPFGKYTKDIIIKDALGTSEVFYTIYSVDSLRLDKFIKENELYLEVVDNISSLQKTAKTSLENNPLENSHNINLDKQPNIWISPVADKINNKKPIFQISEVFTNATDNGTNNP